MPRLSATPIALTDDEEESLLRLSRAHKTPRKLAERASMILLASAGTGAPASFTPEQICTIMALACEPPEHSDLPLSHWSQSELAREAVRRGIVDSISHGSVGRFLKRC